MKYAELRRIAKEKEDLALLRGREAFEENSKRMDAEREAALVKYELKTLKENLSSIKIVKLPDAPPVIGTYGELPITKFHRFELMNNLSFSSIESRKFYLGQPEYLEHMKKVSAQEFAKHLIDVGLIKSRIIQGHYPDEGKYEFLMEFISPDEELPR